MIRKEERAGKTKKYNYRNRKVNRNFSWVFGQKNFLSRVEKNVGKSTKQNLSKVRNKVEKPLILSLRGGVAWEDRPEEKKAVFKKKKQGFFKRNKKKYFTFIAGIGSVFFYKIVKKWEKEMEKQK